MNTGDGKTARVATERVRALMATTPPGPWTHEREGYGLHEVTMDRRRGVHVEGEAEAALIAAAPDLAADLLDAREEVARLQAEARRSDDECRRATLAAQVARSARGVAEGDLARLRAVVAGRSVAPTLAEHAAHFDAGGGFLLAWDGPAGVATALAFDAKSLRRALTEAAWLDSLSLVLPLDRDRRPCAWPAPATGGAPR